MKTAELPPITAVERDAAKVFTLAEVALTCQDCGESFTSIDPNRKYCDLHLVERVNGAGILDDDEPDSLFDLIPQSCADCGQSFAASRRARWCALCAALRSGQVGPASVVCPGCGVAHQVPVLAPTKLCGPCRVDPALTLAGARAREEQARAAWLALDERLQADYAHADDALRTRFENAVTLRNHGTLGGQPYTPAQVQAAWTKALGRGDDLSALLALYDRATTAQQAATRAAEAVRAVEEATHGR